MNKQSEDTLSKRKEVVDVEAQSEPHKRNPSLNESQEFLVLIRKRDFKIVDQLGQTPSKISVLSLILSSEAHRATLMEVLNAAQVCNISLLTSSTR